MDIRENNPKQLQEKGLWIPNTPSRITIPTPQNLSNAEPENQIGHAYEEFLSGFFHSNGNWEVPSGGLLFKGNATAETGKFQIRGRSHFTSLLALQHKASAACTSGVSEKKLDFWPAYCAQESQDSYHIPHGCAYDLNLSPGGTAVAFSSKSTSQIAPITPEKSARVEHGQVAQSQCCSTDERGNDESKGEANEFVATAIDAGKLQTDRELQKSAKDASSSAVCGEIVENCNAGNEANPIIISETPEQKPRRRKHRPKVITEGKPRPRKIESPMQAPCAENSTAKRKYVRKTPLSETPTSTPAEPTEKPTSQRNFVRRKLLNEIATPPLEANGESSNTKSLEPAKTSCRKSLNFGSEGNPGHENNFKSRLNAEEDSKPQAQDGGGGNQVKSTVTLGKGIEVIVETTERGTTYDPTVSIYQMIQDYIALQGKEGLSTSIPIKTGPSCSKGNYNSQQSHAKEDDQMIAHNVVQNNARVILQTDNQLIALQGKEGLSTSIPIKTGPSCSKGNYNSQQSHAKEDDQMIAHNVVQNNARVILQTDNQLVPVITNSSKCNSFTTLTEEGQANRTNKKLFNFNQQSTSRTNLTGIFHNSLARYQEASWFPSICKKKRTEKAQNSITSCTTTVNRTTTVDKAHLQHNARVDPPASLVNCSLYAPHSNAIEAPCASEGEGLKYKMLSSISVLDQTERSTKKRSRVPKRTRDLASLSNIASTATYLCCTDQSKPMGYNVQPVEDSNRPHMCMDALVAKMSGTLRRKKRTKKGVLVSSTSSGTNLEQSQGKIILYGQSIFSANSLGASQEVIWKQIYSVDDLAEQFQHLDISREGRNALVPYGGNQQHNELVLYRSDGTIVPFTGSFVKKRRPRPKVDLDEETNRVWKLLLGNINSEGIDGTDEDNTKQWEDERDVFSGRANSFIARMHLVQGDRRFSQWKGSVVDSVVGVFLTQNVSDHLSSSAFMSLAAHFPLRSESNNKPCYEERASSVCEKPVVCMPDIEDNIKWNEETHQSICDQSSMTIHESELDEEKEVIYSNESSTSSTCVVNSSVSEIYYESIENRSTTDTFKITSSCDIRERTKATDDVQSSQNSVIASQNSQDSPTSQTTERKEMLSKNSSGAGDVIGGSKSDSSSSPCSFKELLSKVGSYMQHEVHRNVYETVLSNESSYYEYNKTKTVEKMYNSDIKNSEVSNAPSNYSLQHHPSSLEKTFELITEEAGFTDVSITTSGRNSIKEPSSPIEVSASQITDENNTTNDPPCITIKEDKHVTIQTQSQDLNIVVEQNNEMQLLKISDETDAMGSSSTLNKEAKNLQRTTETDMIEHRFSETKEFDGMNAITRKAKSRRVGNEIRSDVDWDALRKEADAKGREKERPPNTRDSLDWEAVRCADVDEIANTIKARGMNNMLAERIKSFLNRLVREHGSIDLEWLRYVEPDEAKKFLLSIRGLGLKSVECVRLLTLHHVAFPVDTNVGRIAVRLGWVPLQPLPESLQLHLLELYPVLESIQRYLWPRLCKLDQRTLYELHYQMITFGKVFCTKSKPNCNACPMRGECRHFASAFASARLALPGPEEKGIVATTESRTYEPSPAPIIGQPPLALPQATEQSADHQLAKLNQQSEARHGNSNCEPIVEEPSSPEPECTQVKEIDMEDMFCEDPDEIPTIKLNFEQFTQNLQNYMQSNMELQEFDVSKALVALTAEVASIPMPKLKNVSQLRTEHQVYELPDSHPLLQGLDRREPDDPCSYLLAIWTPGETANSVQPSERSCISQECGKLCDENTCFSCNSIREADSEIVRGTILIPCRTAMRGSFPLNGTYFQVNEVFADHDSSINPIDVPRSWIWNLPRRTVYFGTSIPTIFKGLTTEGIQHCFWRGFVCVRGFEQKTRAPRPLMARLHFPASKLNRRKGKESNG
ncbi:DNA glycosylase/AP lyase ROS1 [Mercurialis annua]|uniref:DNA glycosylase/AP lyase ROS1 n=1 Tax=Mercurialis annua TaxID=3986 RepID=UPI00215E2243|nr:DNA glycosylase/AP lyase ROS1 [Mercurialis annua]XP_050228364.1 DNA glycosylase/AP lyase ROS1 [Mercurialis annua]XP_050228365.1 DNA glycosylase/AP lyase ROS1 [Mercurialis annua]